MCVNTGAMACYVVARRRQLVDPTDQIQIIRLGGNTLSDKPVKVNALGFRYVWVGK